MSTTERERRAAQHGLSLIELLAFIVVVGVAVGGVLSVYSLASRSSADPMLRKQALAVAESLLEEVLAMPYTYCDPDDANVETASSAADCATLAETAMGPEGAETRYSNVEPYDNVNDYHGFSMTGINGPDNAPAPGLGGYTAQIDVAPVGAFNGIPAGETLRVTVTVTAPGTPSIRLSGYRTRYAPNF